ncbi:MAG: 16S rRNA pseudouridine(516) synthase [Eikenella sp.]|nr:16S rRNA pseudouridine(516) synthase [Eikenella sp.]
MNLSKYLQAQGWGSRKQCRWLIRNGLVSVNGHILDNDQTEIDPAAVHGLRLDGEPLAVIPYPRYYLLLNKPAGYETSHKPRDYPSVFSLLPDHLRAGRPQAVGRLDADTTGVLLITNDGALNHRLTSPKHKVAKHYRATLKHPADERLCATLLQGVLLHDEHETVAASKASLAGPTTLLLTLTEGKYHQVKRMVAAAGNRVTALHRFRFGEWDCGQLAEGEWRFIDIPA